MIAARLKRLDKDGDGKVSREEFPGQPAVFDRLDSNKDGFLSSADRAVDADAPGRADSLRLRRLMAMDQDKDGKVSRTEFRGAAAAFDRLDTNKDGFLSREDRRVRQQTKASNKP